MGVHPGNPVTRFATTIAGHARQITRAHTRLDSTQSTVGQHTAQIATANANIATNTANITTNTTNIATGVTNLAALNTRLGGTAVENFLGTLSQMLVYSQSNGGGCTSGGSIVGSTQIDTLVLTTWMNQVHADLGIIITLLRNANLMA